MTRQTHVHRGPGFVIGLITGAVGAGLAVWFASECYQQVSTRVGEAVDDLTTRGQNVRDDVADAVVRGAHEVERIATAAKSA